MPDAVDKLRTLALGFERVEEKTACAGTAIEQASFRVDGKSFLFAQRKGDTVVVRLKLGPSIAEAEAADDAEVGKLGWVTCRWPLKKAPPRHGKKWVRESYGLSTKKKKAATKKKASGKKKSAAKKKTKKRASKG